MNAKESLSELEMLPQPESRPTNRPILAGLWLIAAIPLSILAFGLVSWITGDDTFDAIGFVMVALAHVVAGFFWSRSLLRRTGRSAGVWTQLSGGIGFSLLVWGGRYAIEALDPGRLPFFKKLLGGAIHLEFITLFTLWTGLVAGGSGMVLALGMKDVRLALRLLLAGFLSGALAFLAIALVMDALGFRVGVPRPDGIPSMVITTFLGIWSAALIGSWFFGRILTEDP